MRAHIPIVTLMLLVTPAVVPGLTAATANAETIYVCWDGSGDYLTIQEGIDAAWYGDEVVVCDGVYSGEGNTNLDFAGKAITVRSGSGPEYCIIDCRGEGPAFHFHSGEGGDSVLDGFTITSGGSHAVYIDESSPTIVNCLIFGNGRGIGGWQCGSVIIACTISQNDGAGLEFEGSSSPVVTDCTITGNSDHGVAAHGGSLTVSNCTIIGNTTGYYGGGVYSAESATISECTIAGNTADCGGAVYCGSGRYPRGARVTVSNCEIMENTARCGGAIFCYRGSHTITDCVITGNTASQGGGGVACEASSPTIIGCTITANVVPEDGESGGGGICCYADSNPMISDCTIMGNAADYGAGVYCHDSNPTITNCVIAVNGDERCFGGGLCCVSDSSPTVIDCTIVGNTASDGAGVNCREGSYPTIVDCTIAGNAAACWGGGFECHESNPMIINCTITANTADGFAGGALFCWESSPTITSCTIADNSATYDGGLHCHGGSLTVSDCTISGNTAGGYTGAVFCHYSSSTISDCTITGNVGYDGAVFCLGGDTAISNCTISANSAAGVLCSESKATITNCAIVGNTGGDYEGGGIICLHSTATISNCTIADNTDLRHGGVLCGSGSSATITNCIVWGNSAPQGPEIFVGSSANPSTLGVGYCDVQGGEDGIYVVEGCVLNWGPGNIDGDPSFVDPDGDDYHLSAGSPCIDAGCNWAVPPDTADLDDDGDTSEYTPLDLDGEGRFFDDPDTPDTGCGCPPIVDMGAYEFGETGPQPCPGDLDCDRTVGHSDLAILLTAWHASAEGDLNCDGVTDHADLGTLLGHWGEACP